MKENMGLWKKEPTSYFEQETQPQRHLHDVRHLMLIDGRTDLKGLRNFGGI
jgi:hypothetical protein